MSAADRTASDEDRRNPFVGPRPFYRSDSNYFFGRGREARDVRSLWMAERVLVLHGPSAVGKTSLLNAGILPLLELEGDVDVLPTGRLALQVTKPIAEPPSHNGYSYTLLNSWSQSGRPVSPGVSIAEFLQGRRSRADDSGESRGLLLAIDQFEELFTSFPARQHERENFVTELSNALREVPMIRLLLIVRDDHLATMRSIERRLSYPLTYVRLESFGLAAAKEAVCRPFEMTGWRFADGVADQLVDLLRTNTYTDLLGDSAFLLTDWVEPLLLQIVCSQLWSSLPAGSGAIAIPDLSRFADVDHAIIEFYENAIREIREETEVSEEDLRAWTESVFITEHGTRGNAYRGIVTTNDMRNRVVDAFVDRLILAAEWRAQGTWYELSQDRLISAVRESNAKWRAQHGRPLQLSELLTAGPANFRAAAEEAFSMGNYPSAMRFAQEAESRYRESGDSRRLAQTLVLEGDISRAEGDLNAARENLNAALANFSILGDPNARAETLSALADVCITVGDYDAAEDFGLQALVLQPSSSDALLGLGYAQWYQGSPADAETTFSNILTWNPHHARALAARGQVRNDMGQYNAALADLDLALAEGVTSIDETDTRSARAVALAAIGALDEADRELEIAWARDRNRARTHFRAGQVALRAGRVANAKEELDSALRRDADLHATEREWARELRSAL